MKEKADLAEAEKAEKLRLQRAREVEEMMEEAKQVGDESIIKGRGRGGGHGNMLTSSHHTQPLHLSMHLLDTYTLLIPIPRQSFNISLDLLDPLFFTVRLLLVLGRKPQPTKGNSSANEQQCWRRRMPHLQRRRSRGRPWSPVSSERESHQRPIPNQTKPHKSKAP